MQNLEGNLWNSDFSHIYIEKDACNHPNTIKILNKFSKSKVIKIDHYKEVFSRSRQNFEIQKNSLNLILALKKDNLIYKGADVCEDFGHKNFYYTSSIMNCIYDCEYCYLQGVYPSSNIVIFVNLEDVFCEVAKLLKKHPMYLCISYDTDLLAFENITSFVSNWIEFVENNENLTVELRTKSSNFKAIRHIKPTPNMIMAWTLSPKEIIDSYEHKTPSFEARLESIKEALYAGWKVRLCFDPMLYVKDWKDIYEKCIIDTFSKIPPEKVYDVSIGVFRMSKVYLKNIRDERNDSKILSYPFDCNGGVCSYPDEITQKMTGFLYEKIKKFIPDNKIYV